STTYYGPDWSTTPQDLPLTYVEGTNVGGRIEHEGATTDDLPVAGELFVELHGGSDEDDDSEWFRVTVNPVAEDEDGELAYVRAFTASPVSGFATAGGAEEKAIPLPSRAVLLPASLEVIRWQSLTAGGEYVTLREAAAAERLAQATKAGGAPLRTVVTTVPGLVGPQNRATLSGAPPCDAEPLVAVVTGDAVDLKNGLTKAAPCGGATYGTEADRGSGEPPGGGGDSGGVG